MCAPSRWGVAAVATSITSTYRPEASSLRSYRHGTPPRHSDRAAWADVDIQDSLLFRCEPDRLAAPDLDYFRR